MHLTIPRPRTVCGRDTVVNRVSWLDSTFLIIILDFDEKDANAKLTFPDSQSLLLSL